MLTKIKHKIKIYLNLMMKYKQTKIILWKKATKKNKN
jgi:hypothetical protein